MYRPSIDEIRAIAARQRAVKAARIHAASTRKPETKVVNAVTGETLAVVSGRYSFDSE